MRRTTIALFAAVVALGLAGCGGDGTDTSSGGTASDTASGSASPSPSGDITVLAAASLTESFTTLGKQFEAAHPGVKVTLSFAASSALATQITSGAPADVFASASARTMDAVVAAGAAADPKTFAKNAMEIAVPPANPGKVTGVSSLASADVKTALCQPQVPCGSTAQKVFTNARVTVTPVTLEPDVKSVLSKVQLGEVDAGVVYVTDVLAAGDKVKGIEIPDDVNASTSYPIAALTRSTNAATAAAFVEYVLSPAGTSVLTAAGFQQP
jgi:molybdate transport system substrate-binding protein